MLPAFLQVGLANLFVWVVNSYKTFFVVHRAIFKMGSAASFLKFLRLQTSCEVQKTCYTR